ncbi:hypothetical protein K1719_032453 [Acacia pycnantha]|nr:hypothetical protein K1719_032453 [Acacia pycnantha]
MGVAGVAIAMVWTNLNLFLLVLTVSRAGLLFLFLRFQPASLCALSGGARPAQSILSQEIDRYANFIMAKSSFKLDHPLGVWC